MYNDIAIFVQIVRSGSLSMASKRLSIPANTLSRRLALLEQRLGTSLLFRSTRGLRCTPAGECLYVQSFESVDKLMASVESLKNIEGQPHGQVRIQVPTSFFEYAESDFLDIFFKKYPRVELELIISNEERDLVNEGIDLLFCVGKPERSSYIRYKLCEVSFGLYASEEYLMRHGVPSSVEELTCHEHIQLLGRKSENKLTLKRLGEVFHIPIKGRLSSNSMLSLINAASQGLGIALLEKGIASIKASELVHVLPEYYVPTEGFCAIFPSQKSLTPAAAVFLEYMINKTAGYSLSEEAL